MIRRVLPLAMLAVLVAGIGATASTAKPDRQKADQVTIKLAVFASREPAYNVLIPNFERVYPNIKVEASFYDTLTLPTLLRTELAAGNAPDVFMTNVSVGSLLNVVLPLARGGYLADLSKQPWVPRVYPAAKPYVTLNGKTYAWPLDIIPYPVMVNTSLFKQLGLTVPTTFGQVLTLCKKVATDGSGKYLLESGYGLRGLQIEMANSFVMSVDPNFPAQRAAGKITFDSSPQWHNTLQATIDMKNAGCFEPHPEASTASSDVANFTQGKSVMLMANATAIGLVKVAAPTMKWNLIPFPAAKASNTKFFSQPSDGLSVNSKSPNLAAAIKLVDFFAREQQSSLYAKVNGTLAPLDIKKEDFSSIWNPFKPLIQAGKVGTPWNVSSPNPQTTGAYLNAFTGILTGQLTIDQALQAMDTAYALGPLQ